MPSTRISEMVLTFWAIAWKKGAVPNRHKKNAAANIGLATRQIILTGPNRIKKTIPQQSLLKL
jgi:hypothetical protein